MASFAVAGVGGHQLIVVDFGEAVRTITWPTVVLAVLTSSLAVMWAALYAIQTPVRRVCFVVLVAVGACVFFFVAWACTRDQVTLWWLVLVHVAVTGTMSVAVWKALGRRRQPAVEYSGEPVMAQ